MKARFTERHPYLFAVLMMLVVLIVYFFSGAVAMRMSLPDNTLYFAANLVLAVIAVIFLTAMRFWKTAGFRALARPQDLKLYWVAFVPALVNLVIYLLGGQSPSLPAVGVYFVLSLLVGFVEETFFRGLMLRPLLAKGPWRAVLISSILFGLMHVMNVAAGSNPLYVLLQIGYAFAIGFGFAAVALRTGVIWPLVLAHFAIDFFALMNSGAPIATGVDWFEIAISAVYIVAFTAYGIWLMKPANAQEQPAAGADPEPVLHRLG